MTTLKEKLLKKYPQLNDKTVNVVIKKMRSRPKPQRGKGFLDKLVNKTVDTYNKVLSKETDKRDHVLKDGEKHLIFFNEKGALTRARFSGPGTDIVGNLKKLLKENDNNISLALSSDNFISDADKTALAHDIRYSIRTTPEQVRDADKKFVNKLKENMKKAGLKNPRILFNNFPSYAGIRMKMIAEDAGLVKKGSVAKRPKDLSKEDEDLMEEALEHLNQQGYGEKIDKVKDFFRENQKALAGISAATIAGLALSSLGKDDKSKPKSNFQTKTVLPGVTVTSQAGLDLWNEMLEKRERARRKEFGDMFFEATSKRGRGENPKNRPERKGKGRSSKWIEHVKDYAKKNNIKYGEALKKAGSSYKK